MVSVSHVSASSRSWPFKSRVKEWTGVAVVDMPEARPGRNWHSRDWSLQATQPVNESSRR